MTTEQSSKTEVKKDDTERRRKERLEKQNKALVEQELEPNYQGSPPIGVEFDPVTGEPVADDDNPFAPDKS